MIKQLNIRNFRNIKSGSVQINNNNLVFFGPNGSGKTSVLEAIYFSLFFSSFRTRRISDLLKFNEDVTNLNLLFFQNNIEHEVTIGFNTKKVKIKFDGSEVQSKKDLIGKIKTILLNSETINLIDLSPKIRRSFLDVHISQFSQTYLNKLQNFNKIVKIKRDLLKHNDPDQDYLSIVNQEFIELNKIIVTLRQKFVVEIEKYANSIYKYISGHSTELKVTYQEGKNVNLAVELKVQKLMFGSMFDDFKVSINGMDLRTFGSQGQKRTAAIAIILAQLNFSQKETHENFLILVDDVHLELDNHRQENLFKYFQKKEAQIIYATTDLDKIPKTVSNKSQIYELHKGKIMEQQ